MENRRDWNMWSRSELKERAKAVLRTNYWEAFWISIVISLAGGNRGGWGGSGGSGGSSGSDYSNSYSSLDTSSIMIIISIVLVTILFIIAIRAFLGYPLEVGGRRYFVKSAQYEDNKKCFKFAFSSENYMGIVSAMFLKGVRNFLWFLLLVIPGIIKFYSYRMVPYILADNPNIGGERAIELSNRMTDGHKFNIFVLDLSFIGWYILGVFACCIGGIFVVPYENATFAELYLVLRQNSIDNGWSSHDELLLNYENQDEGMGLL